MRKIHSRSTSSFSSACPRPNGPPAPLLCLSPRTDSDWYSFILRVYPPLPRSSSHSSFLLLSPHWSLISPQYLWLPAAVHQWLRYLTEEAGDRKGGRPLHIYILSCGLLQGSSQGTIWLSWENHLQAHWEYFKTKTMVLGGWILKNIFSVLNQKKMQICW